MRQLSLVIAAPILAIQPGLEEAAQLTVERALQLRLLSQQLRQRGVDRQLELVLPRRRLLQPRYRNGMGCTPRLRSHRERLFQTQRGQPIAQHLVPLLTSEQHRRTRWTGRAGHA